MFDLFDWRAMLLFPFFLHMTVYSVLLLIKWRRQDDLSSGILGCFIMLCALYICPWLLGHSGWYSNQPYRDIMFYVPFQHVLWLGPLCYFYTLSITNRSFTLRRIHLLHFIPGIIWLGYAVVVFVTDQLILKDYYFYADGRDKDLSLWYQVTGLLSMLIYTYLSLREYKHFKHLAVQVVSYADSIIMRWLEAFLVAFLIMQLARLGFLLFYPGWGAFATKFWYYLIFSVVAYYISISGYANTVRAQIAFRWSESNKRALIESDSGNTTEVLIQETNSEVKEEELEKLRPWQSALESAMMTDQLFTDPELSLNDVAEVLGANPRTVSRTINLRFGMNFNDFVNQYRVNAVVEAMANGEAVNQTLLGLALDSGFNSKATFNRAFKKFKGQSPANYLKTRSEYRPV
jgi:AraC-like DNA-binding protein